MFLRPQSSRRVNEAADDSVADDGQDGAVNDHAQCEAHREVAPQSLVENMRETIASSQRRIGCHLRLPAVGGLRVN